MQILSQFDALRPTDIIAEPELPYSQVDICDDVSRKQSQSGE